MATTTQILFNSPALHSLKRDQLVKLCKTHSLKANGKNVELIERLKQHAQALPPDALSAPSFDDEMDVEEDLPGGFPGDSAAQGGEEEQDEDYAMQDVIMNSRFGIPRPSEQWEVVMDDIAEVDESGMGTMSSKGSLRTVSNGEFGTHTSKGSVTSSLKAFATSLGIKRAVSKSACNQDNDDGSVNSKERNPVSFSPGKLFSTRARDSLADHATPYSHIPPSDSLPETDHFKFSTPDASMLGLEDDEDGENAPVPGTSNRAGRPAPLGARLSMGVGQSTIRLVTVPSAPRFEDPYLMSPPRLAAIQPDFDIKMGTPSAGRILSVWPASPRTAGADVGDGGAERLYPRLPLADLQAARDGGDDDEDAPMPGGMFASASTPARTPARTRTTTDATITAGTPRTTSTPRPVDEPDMFSPSKPTAPVVAAAVPHVGVERPSIPRSAPFLFGSPLPRRDTPKTALSAESDAGVSNVAFEGAAKSVLEEMHRRLAEAQKEKEKNGEARPAPPTQTAGASIFGGLLFGAGASAAGGGGEESAADRYAKAHEAQFAKMDSIANHYAARRPAGNTRKRKSEALGAGARAGQKRRSSAAGTRVISNGARKRGVPGGFGADEEDEESDVEEEGEAGGEKASERDEDDMGARRSSKRMRIAEGWDVHRGQRVSLAPPLPPAAEEKKARERDAVKRELDAAKARRRSSRGRVSMGGNAAPPAKGKASRFGFLSSAKSIVKNVWGFGGKTKTAANEKAPPSSIPVPKAAAPVVPTNQPKKSDVQNLGKGAVPAPVNAVPAQSGRKPSGTHSRIPSVSSTTSKMLHPSSAADAKTIGTVNSARSSTSRARSPIPSFAQAPPAASRPSSIAGTARSRTSSTAGTATSTSRQASRTCTVSSMGTRSSLVSGGSTAVSSIGTHRSVASTSTLASTSSKTDKEAKDQPSMRKRTSSLLAPTASSLAKVNAAMRPSVSGRTSGLPSVSEKQSSIPRASKSPIAGRRMSPISPPSKSIFSQPLDGFGSPGAPSSPAYHPSLGAAASTLFSNIEDSSPSKIPRPAVLPPKPKALVARKPRISRSRVIAKVGAQRAAAAQGSASSPTGRTRSSFGARKSFGGVKSGRASAGAEGMRGAAKKRARQSEYMRRKSRGAADGNA
ncbi:uncharacterized protein TRAVEDRAFT_40763 [Trametes versicolor FP-101664 SS1]|uniref:SAP domain-containing protein n=1 Tax=Trametes versicolor (strain FP-101664) TaxID=717944 RepID=R7S8G5_TRAVS|nr:uncharacterized protein TRAVEDRAFT_40763 [Trametes versicolor FP-101664 SS1]EIW51952.1 hypothetical protein TRAVEDRAFT_40763 [Trametes versicolor FP-101664 SS1]